MTDDLNPAAPQAPAGAVEAQVLTSSDVGSADVVLGLGGEAASAVVGDVGAASTLPDNPANPDPAPTTTYPAPPTDGNLTLPSPAVAPEAPAPTVTEPVIEPVVVVDTAPAPIVTTPAPPPAPAFGMAAGAAPVSDILDPKITTAVVNAVREACSPHLNAIDSIAVYWGGEHGVAIRNLVGRIRQELQ